MKPLRIAILGCGTVGGGVATILTAMKDELSARAGRPVLLEKIVELDPKAAAQKFSIPINLFCGGGKDLTAAEAGAFINEIIADTGIDLIVETIGGSNDFVYNLALNTVKSKKHLVTANKALLALRGQDIFAEAATNSVEVGLEAAVCGAIPIIKTIRESFTGDTIEAVSGIFNGTSNYILSKMQDENLGFEEALKLAQVNGYAETDPTLDINGFDAAHKLVLLAKLSFGVDLSLEQIAPIGIQGITREDIDFAREIQCKIKLICYARKDNGNIYATVRPMMVRNTNFISNINGSTNAVRVENRYAGRHIMVGKGAGSFETASSIVGDIVFIGRYAGMSNSAFPTGQYGFADARQFVFPYLIIFKTADLPGITGLVTTAIGEYLINIDTVSHNRHGKDNAVFSLATMPCRLEQIEKAIAHIKKARPGTLLAEPKVMPILE